LYEAQLGEVVAATEEESPLSRSLSISQVIRYRNLPLPKLERSIERLVRDEMVTRNGEYLSLTAEGLRRARELTRYHRLWEAYLSEKVRLPSDHVHDDAEEMEHVLTGELAERLIATLDVSGTDPHGKAIPDGEGEEEES
jgi:manganese/zinc/iron transport system permease protein